MASPGICVHTGDEWDPKTCRFHFLTSKKKFQGYFHNNTICGYEMPEWSSQEQRFALIRDWTVDMLKRWDRDQIHCYYPEVTYLESYSYASTGKAFSIGENTGVLKNKLWTLELKYEIVAPTVIKKYATGKGNANKELLEEHFLRETTIDIRSIMDQSDRSDNPSSDLIDAYYICKYGFHAEYRLL